MNHRRPFVTLEEVTTKWGAERRTVQRLIRERRIRSKRVGRRLHLNPEDADRELGWPQDQAQPEAEPVDADVAAAVARLKA